MSGAEIEGQARAWAEELHRGQRYGEHPYAVHLEDVVGVLGEFGERDPRVLAAAWLHDAVEDTATTVRQIEVRMGVDVARMVEAVSDESGDTRAAAKRATYPKIRRLPGAVRVKLADRIANVRASRANDAGRLAMYRREHSDFRRALWRAGEADAMWRELERLLASPDESGA